jgi:hypothetical protein
MDLDKDKTMDIIQKHIICSWHSASLTTQGDKINVMLQVGRSWVRFPMSFDFSVDLNLPAAL